MFTWVEENMPFTGKNAFISNCEDLYLIIEHMPWELEPWHLEKSYISLSNGYQWC